MELSVRVLCRPEIARGFSLAGIRVDEADEASAASVLQRMADEPAVGIILVEERLRRSLPQDLLARLDRRASPIVVPFPSPSWEGPGIAEQYVLEILRQAVGYRVRPR